MPDENEELTIELPEGELDIAAGHAEAPAEKPGKQEVAPEEGIEELRAKLANEQRARAEAQEQARQLQQVAHISVREKEQGDIALISSAIQQVKQTGEKLEDEYATAMESGDYRAAAKVQTKMAENINNLKQLENGLDALTSRPQRQAPQPRPAQQPATDDARVEKAIENLTPKAQDWVRRNPDYVLDTKKMNRMVAAHHQAMAEDLAVDSPEYFAYVERTLGIGGQQQNDTPAPRQNPQRQAPPPAAPARAGGGGGSRTVRLTPAEIEVAKMSGLTPEEYAANRERAVKNGEISR